MEKNKFRKAVFDSLIEGGGDLYVLSDFYEACCVGLGLDYQKKGISNYTKFSAKIRYQLNKLVSEGLLTKTRIGTGFLGKTDFGMTSINVYGVTDKWKESEKLINHQ